MRKTKVGPAFSESVHTEKITRRRNFSGILSPDILSFLPLLCLFLVAGFFVVRLFYLQVMRSDYYRRLSDQNRLRTVTIPAPRGVIFDRENRPLVSNSPAFEILDKNKKIVWIDKDEALNRIAKGEQVYSDVQREYLYKDVFAHVLGYTGQISENEMMMQEFQGYEISDFVGKMGLEQQYESVLHGVNGKELYEVDAQGNKVRFLGSDQPTLGQNLYTTLDIDIQKAVTEAMKEVKKGAVIVSDPRNGGILAMYSKPTFDPNIFTHDENYKPTGEYQEIDKILTDTDNQPLLNRAISGVYPPGSTYKLVSATAALESGVMSRDTIVKDTGVLKVGKFSFGNWYFLQYGRTEGDVNIVKAISRSNDIYFYKAAEKTGPEKLAAWSHKFGLGQKLGIDLAGEVAGVVPDEKWKEENIGEGWYLGDNYNMGIGQGYLLATPLQVNSMTVPFANGGTLYKPHLIQGQEQVIESNLFHKENLDAIREGMRQSCDTGGVAFPFFDFKVKNDRLPIDGKDFISVNATGSGQMTHVVVGCKTGTAQVGTEETKPHAWITVIAPIHNPEIVVTVLAENSGEGSAVAGPIAKEILTDYFEKKR